MYLFFIIIILSSTSRTISKHCHLRNKNNSVNTFSDPWENHYSLRAEKVLAASMVLYQCAYKTLRLVILFYIPVLLQKSLCVWTDPRGCCDSAYTSVGISVSTSAGNAVPLLISYIFHEIGHQRIRVHQRRRHIWKL